MRTRVSDCPSVSPSVRPLAPYARVDVMKNVISALFLSTKIRNMKLAHFERESENARMSLMTEELQTHFCLVFFLRKTEITLDLLFLFICIFFLFFSLFFLLLFCLFCPHIFRCLRVSPPAAFHVLSILISLLTSHPFSHFICLSPLLFIFSFHLPLIFIFHLL